MNQNDQKDDKSGFVVVYSGVAILGLIVGFLIRSLF